MIGWTLRHRSTLTLKTEGGTPATKCMMLIGIEPSQAWQRLWKSLREARQMGIKIIVIDPRRTPTAELADIWLQPRPGTDTALLMAMVHVIITEGLYDKAFVDKWCYGFDKLTERAAQYTPEAVEKITSVPAEKIIEAARMYGTQKPGVSTHGMGLEHLANNQEGIQARIILSAITGNIDVRGGDYMSGPVKWVNEMEMQLADKLSPDQRQKQIGADKFKFLSGPGRQAIWDQNMKFWGRQSTNVDYAHYPSVLRAMITGQPYPVRACITIASNPLITEANTKLVYKALKSLDLYVVKDFWLTPSAMLADYVLPTASWLERPELQSANGTDTFLIAGDQALPNMAAGEYEHMTDYEFFRGLGLRLGQGDFWTWRNLEEAYDYQLKPLNLTFREFMDQRNGLHFPPDEHKKYEKMGGFGTPTGKLELYSTILENLGYDPLPAYDEPKESPVASPELAKQFPLMLITGGRFQPYYHSEHRQIESLRKRRPNPRVQLHPDTAKQLGIDDGDWVWIETPRGRIRQQCVYFDGIDRNVVHAEHGWWFPELPAEEPWLHGVWESNVNVLTDDDPLVCNPKSGGWPLKTALCRVYKCP